MHLSTGFHEPSQGSKHVFRLIATPIPPTRRFSLFTSRTSHLGCSARHRAAYFDCRPTTTWDDVQTQWTTNALFCQRSWLDDLKTYRDYNGAMRPRSSKRLNTVQNQKMSYLFVKPTSCPYQHTQYNGRVKLCSQAFSRCESRITL